LPFGRRNRQHLYRTGLSPGAIVMPTGIVI
jgi:hypothetical protein